jgi:molybdopterin/thiamine biosynthesis adenylyltransferase
MDVGLVEYLKGASREEGGFRVVPHGAIREAARRAGLAPIEAEMACLEAGLVPARYQRNMGTLGMQGQLRLLRSCVGVCGLGGLGGYVAELLARYGVGRLILVDGDAFEENNLNRQLLCRESDLGRPKAERAGERVREVNSSLQVIALQLLVTTENVTEVFSGAEVVVDALDNVPSRLALEEGCARLGVPMVHGAIAGHAGQVMTVYPGDPGLRVLYGDAGERGVEVVEGNPPTTPALVATLQAQEVVKVICGGETIRHGFLFLDTSTNLFQFIPLK